MSEAPGGTEGTRAEPGSAAGAGAGHPGDGGGAAAVADLEAQLAEARDLRLRALADADNARKRCASQIRRAEEEARAQVAREWLPVLDNLERALAHADAEPSVIIEGIQAIRLQALQVLARLGFSRRDDTGRSSLPGRPRRRPRHGRRGDAAGLRRRRPPAAARPGCGGRGGMMATRQAHG